jgi:hypothetical protein
MFDINNLKLSEIKEISKLLSMNNQSNQIENTFWEIGKNYFIRTVTMHQVGKLIFASPKELVLSNASWIADDGRFHNALRDGVFNEIEPFVDDICVNRESIVDATLWRHKLPTEQK